jgi:hypothetical protein
VIVLRFGKSGRLARICEMAFKLAAPSAIVYTASRAGSFVLDDVTSSYIRHDSVESLLQMYPAERFVLLDTSVDHSSTANLVVHEAFKSGVITTLNRRNTLAMVLGFSSGITMVDVSRISDAASHMLEYRNQKLAQETLFHALTCPVFLPNIFTLVGPITYATQGAAWANILKARLRRASDIVLNEPHAKKAWTSEFQVFKSVLDFLAEETPKSIFGPLVNGVFTLSEVASGAYLRVPALKYSIGDGSGWLDGDYVPSSYVERHQSIIDELIRSLCQSNCIDHETGKHHHCS